MIDKSSRYLNTQSGVYSESLHGLAITSGDLICTTSGVDDILVGEFWRFLGRLVPGEVDHVIVYLGPDGLCVEAGPRGVNLFVFFDGEWVSKKMIEQRGPYVDRLVGIAYPLAGRGFSSGMEHSIREQMRNFCLSQAKKKKPYNLNFFNPDTEDAFYCSQLPYQAYIQHGINLNTGLGLPDLIGSEAIIFPQEIWASCVHKSVPEN